MPAANVCGNERFRGVFHIMGELGFVQQFSFGWSVGSVVETIPVRVGVMHIPCILIPNDKECQTVKEMVNDKDIYGE